MEIQNTEYNLQDKTVEIKKIRVKLPAFVKNFFFTELEASPQFMESQKKVGIINTVSIIISPEKTFMRCTSNEFPKGVDETFTEEEKARMLKTFKIKEKTVTECKLIIFMLDIKKQQAHIMQKKYDGSIKEITL